MGVAAVGKVGRHEARVCGVVGAVAGADIEGELNLAALVEALADRPLRRSEWAESKI